MLIIGCNLLESQTFIMKTRIFLFEGMDNCLKDTLIKKLREKLPADTHVLKYSNPPHVSDPEKYQREHFEDMFDLIASTLGTSSRTLILNRAHLGEYIYAPIYRGYEGDWIFSIEKEFLAANQLHDSLCLLILLVDSNNEKLKTREDGKSFSKEDDSKLDDERRKFLDAFERSHFTRKIKFDLSQFLLPNKDQNEEIDVATIFQRLSDSAML